ncbi:2-oxoisovalerate dehydrogenase subunit alpha 2, mitochondrial-like [Quillaja saponaria]|uniref:3-methyl-2-oxobutanoate dehydrogenase (2-methylpropanoyl-transferring) n=1 Tax=Quillaja saponaria TaxID=32244 RepID=A0AAD7PJH1_QUISA|nr:2-oxoisovalerate dehydrogenase subunit alpha 2, mitochondrial-like [Quillaja saponaria]
MSFSIRKSTLFISQLKSKMGLLGLPKQNSWSSSTYFHREAQVDQNFRYPDASFNGKATFLSSRRFESTKAQESLNILTDPDKNQVLDFPGGKLKLTPEMRFISETPCERAHCYRVLDDDGKPIMGSTFVQVHEDVAVKMYSNMVTLQTMDSIFYEAQRQGRISFYVTTVGEEAINIASAAALTIDDLIFPQYREPGVLLWRGFTLQEFANQLFGNKDDYGKGRQMPAHYGSNKLNYITVASTVATQLSHAVGAAYSLRMDKKYACAVTYFGDGGSSEGDFHAALNFAAVAEAPVIFICRNNGWAISTPTSDQFRSDGVVVKGRAYGVRSIRVDGNDALAMYSAVHTAREMAITKQRPILIEALTYRTGHHSTSDDSTKYRSADEIKWWRVAQEPVAKFRKWIEGNGWWNDEAEIQIRDSARQQILHAIQVAEKVEKPPTADIFTDVYDVLPFNLREQEQLLKETIKKHPQDYQQNVPV